jgi:signal transduction histidine kinase
MLMNVLENAVDYTPAGGAIAIAAEINAESAAELRIANTVEGLTRDDVPKLFDRFWRRDAARTSVDHSGLGLALVRAFALALGFEVTATLIDEDRRLVLALAIRH